ncbi:MAG TPA: SGNH/GDSL hydrolase family protein [Candidatus Sumerlaeota bacterium]|nr:SGNH/GDSL hydrolase family protein [Candidatus Sumerlaeota bacterium]
MTSSRQFLFSLLVMLAMLSGNLAAQEVKWHDAATSFAIEGRGWTGTAGPFDRLPDSARDKVPQTAWDLSKESAGLCVRFVTDAPTVSVRWSLTSSNLAMPHMPATGVSGLDLYARSTGGLWKFVGNGRPHQVDNEAAFTFTDNDRRLRECLLYLPLYNGIRSLEIGVPADARLEAPSPRPGHLRRPVVVYGTSITQGGCASRPGMAWPAILGRLLDRPVINLGFSASGTMEPPIGEVLAELDPAAYVIDCLWNIGNTSQEDYTRRITSLVQLIRKAHPDTPIVFVGQSLIQPEAHPTDMTLKQEAAVLDLQKQGIRNLYAVPGTHLIGDDGEGTVDGVHLTDMGMARQAQCLLPVLQDLLR